MPNTLAQKVRAKFPGVYDDMDDASLEKAVLAKHPEYQDLTSGATAGPTLRGSDTTPSAGPSAWQIANTGIVPPEAIGGDAYSANVELLGPTGVQAPHGGQSPFMAGIEQFARGMSKDVIEAASGFTSPLSLGLMALGGAGAASKGLPYLARAAQAGGEAASVGFGLKGAADVTEAATAPGLNPWERAAGVASGGSEMAGGAAGYAGGEAGTIQRETRPVMREPAPTIARDMPQIAGNMTRGEVDQLASANGVDLSFGQATGHKGGRAVDWMAEQSVNPQFRNQQARNAVAVDGWIAGLRGDVAQHTTAGRPLSFAGTAKDLITQIGDRATAEHNAVHAAYDNITVTTGTGRVFKAAKAVNNVDLQATRNLVKAAVTDEATGQPLKLPPDAQGVYDKLMKYVDESSRPNAGLTTYEQAKTLRTYLMDLASSNDPAYSLPPPQRRMLNTAVGTVDKAIEDALRAKGGQQAMNSWRGANDMNKKFKSTYEAGGTLNDAWNLYRSKGKGNVTTGANEEAVLKAVLSTDSPQDIALMHSKGVDMGQVQQTVLDNIRSTGFRRTVDPRRGVELGGYQQDALQSLFHDKPQVLRELLAASETYRSLGLKQNPSGTGSTIRTMKLASQATAAVGGLATGNVIPAVAALSSEAPFAGAAAAATSPKVKQLLTTRAVRTTPFSAKAAPVAAAGGASLEERSKRAWKPRSLIYGE